MWQLKTLLIFKCLLFLCETIQIDFVDYALKLEEKLNHVKKEIQNYEQLMKSILEKDATVADNVKGLLLNASDDFNFVVKGEQLNEQTNTDNVIKLDIISKFIGNLKNSKNAEDLIEIQDGNHLPKKISLPEVLTELDKLMIKETEKQGLQERMAKLYELTRYRKQINSIVNKTKKEFYFVQDANIFEAIGFRIMSCLHKLNSAFGDFMKNVIRDKKEKIKKIIENGKKKILAEGMKEKYNVLNIPKSKYLKFVKVDLSDKYKEKENLINEIKNLKHNKTLKGKELKKLKKEKNNSLKNLELYIEFWHKINILVDEIYDNINKLYFEGDPAQINYNKLFIIEPYTEYRLYKEFNIVIEIMYAKLTNIFDWKEEPKLLTEIVVLRELITGYTNVLEIQETELKPRLAKEDKKHSNDSVKKEKGLIESEDDQNTDNVQDKINELKNETKSYLSNILLAYEQIYDIIIIKNRDGKSIKRHTNVKNELLKTLKEANALNSELKKSFASEILTYYQNE